MQVMNYFITSDPHYGHLRIIEYCNRPFKSLDDMNTQLINRWNSRVKDDDVVYILGDFCFTNTKNAECRGEGINKKWLHWWNQLNGVKVLARGNHDSNNSAKTLISHMVLEFGGKKIGVIHRPSDIPYTNANVDYWIHGHVHNNRPKAYTYNGVVHVNACVEVWNYYPVKLHEINSWVGSNAFKRECTELKEKSQTKEQDSL